MQSRAPVNPELQCLAGSCPEALTDEELMRVLGGTLETGARDDLFGEIFRRYHPRVLSWCFRITHNKGSALDLTQEVFFKAYRHMQSFRGDCMLSTWLYAITRNHCLSSIKRMASDPVEAGESVPPDLRDQTAPAPDRIAERNQLSKRMWRMLETNLEPMEARVMALHYGYEIPLATITRHLRLANPSGAKAYIVNARRKLNGVINRKRLDSDLVSPEPVRTAA